MSKSGVIFLLLLCQLWLASSSNSNIAKIQKAILNLKSSMNLSEPMLHQLQKLEKSIIADGPIPADELTWNPIQILSNIIINFLCAANLPGNYQNPFYCNQFIMCEPPGAGFVWQCPASFLQYVPTPDLCGYTGEGYETCPWHSLWTGSGDDPNYQASCATIGQHTWDEGGQLTIPVDPTTSCGSEIAYCHDFQQTGTGVCAEGYGYSKSYNGCLPVEVCEELDDFFDF